MLDSTEITIRFLRACGPAGLNEVAGEIFRQCVGFDSLPEALVEANRVLRCGLETGLFEYFNGWLDCFTVKPS